MHYIFNIAFLIAYSTLFSAVVSGLYQLGRLICLHAFSLLVRALVALGLVEAVE